jgi:hypothetical protein
VFVGGLQLFAWGTIAVFKGASSSATILTVFLTITNLGGAISEVVNDAMIAEAGKNKIGAQQGANMTYPSSICISNKQELAPRRNTSAITLASTAETAVMRTLYSSI